MAATEDWQEDDLFELVRRAYPLPRSVAGRLRLRSSTCSRRASARSAAAAAPISTAIACTASSADGAERGSPRSPQAARSRTTRSTSFVAEPDETVVGTLDEDFAVESLAGDVFLLGTTSWRIRRVEAGRVRVEDAHGAAPSIPFWRGEAPGRTAELSSAVAEVREKILELSDESGPDSGRLLINECGLDRRGAEQAVLVCTGRRRCSRCATDHQHRRRRTILR